MTQKNLPSHRHILDVYFRQSEGSGILAHQIESFNQFMDVDIPEIISMSNPIKVGGSPEIPLQGPRSALATATGLSSTAAKALVRQEESDVDMSQMAGETSDNAGNTQQEVMVVGGGGGCGGVGSAASTQVKHEYEISIELEKITFRKPTIFENNGAIYPMMPNDARLRNLTYASPLNIDVKVVTTFIDHTRGGIRESRTRIFPNIHLGKIPIMLKSKYCLLSDQRHVHPGKLGECAEDMGGYFIIQGGERAMISMERMSENRPFVFRNGRQNIKDVEVVEIKCIGPDNDQVPKSNSVKIMETAGLMSLRATIPRIKTEIPLFILFRALGIETDKEIYELIVDPANVTDSAQFENIFTESMTEAASASVSKRADAIAWLAQHITSWSPKISKTTAAEEILAEELFPQIGGVDMAYEKACFLAHMARKVLWVHCQRIPNDDRDAYPNKRVDVPGFLLADLFRKTYNNRMVKDIKKGLSKEIHSGSWRANGNWGEIVNINNINKIIKSTIMDVTLRSALATGNFGSGKIGGPQKIGVSQVLNRLNYVSTVSHLRRISTPIEKTGKLIAPRKLHNTQWGFICPCETPEGHGVGVIKNMASTSIVSIFSSPITVAHFIHKFGKLIPLRGTPVDILHKEVRVFLNGSWIGMLRCGDAPAVVDELRKAKRAGILHIHTGIVWKNSYKELWLTTEAGRILRPVWYAAAIREVLSDRTGTLAAAINSIQDWDQLLLFQTPGGRNLLEYLDAGETEGTFICMDVGKLLNTEEGLEATHVEIHPSIILGTAASMIPFPDHNQSPRNAYQSAMGKQAMGLYALNFRDRFDAMSHVLCYPEVPHVSPYMSRFYGAQNLPAGQNVIVAIMTYTGYNQEDSNMMNRAALERGRYRSIFYRTYKDEERKNQSSGEEEKFCRPLPEETKHMKNANYAKLEEDGFIKENTFVTPDDILIGKVVPLRVPTGMMLPVGSKKCRDVSKTPKNNESGFVDRVYKNRNGEGYSFAKIRIRQDRVPEIGDKFCLTSDHEVMTRNRGWVPISEVSMDDNVAQLNTSTGYMEYVKPLETLVFDHDGDLYEVESQGVSLRTTLNHRMWVQQRDKSSYTLAKAEDIIGKRVRYQSDGPINREDYELSINGEVFSEEKMDALIMICGIWMAEGWIYISDQDHIARLEFAANKRRVQEALIDACETIGFKYNLVDSSLKFYINHSGLAHHLFPYNVGAINKHTPDWVFELSARQARLFIKAMCLGDGHETTTSLHYSTSSIRLRDNLQILCQHAGFTSYYAKRYDIGHTSEMSDGRKITSTAINWDIGIRRTRLRPTINHSHTHEQHGQTEMLAPYTGKVYCIRVPSEVFLVRRHGRIVWTGNSSRHGQKGTMGMILNPEDMPQTAGGLVPDIIINPHCIPSRMTIAQLMETLLSKIGCAAGAMGDGTPFGEASVENMARLLRDVYGMEPHGNEILYNGYTGRMMETSIFIGPCYYQRLRHCSADKIHSRASGPLVMLTRQPAEGRARDGGLRFGEMGRDCVVAHGVSKFQRERFMTCSDGFGCWVCRQCGLIAIANEKDSIWACRGCENTTDFAHVEIPYASKLFLQELETMCVASRLLTTQKMMRTVNDIVGGAKKNALTQ